VGTGGDVHLVGGPGGTVSGAGGPVYVEAGTPTEGAGGFVQIAGASGVGTDRAGGAVTITAGAATGSALAGAISLIAGQSVTGLAGAITVQAGAATSGNTAGGNVSLTAGVGSGTQAGGTILLQGASGGATGAGSAITLTGGIGGVTSGAGGAITLTGGAATTDSNGGAVTINGGLLNGTGLNGSLNLGTSNTLGVNFGVATPAQITGNVDDYSGTNNCLHARLSTDASRDVTGFVNGSAGRLLHIRNVGSFDIVLKHQTGSAAGNQITTADGADFTISTGQDAWLEYDGVTSKWRVGPAGSGGGAAGLANIAYVSKLGDDATAQLGSIALPYLTIQAAVTDAIAAGTPYTIQVGPGTFTENITWGEQLSLLGTGAVIATSGSAPFGATSIVGTLALTAGATTVNNIMQFANVAISGAITLDFSGKTSGGTSLSFDSCFFAGGMTLTRKNTTDKSQYFNTWVQGNTNTNFGPTFASGSRFNGYRPTIPSGEQHALHACWAEVLVASGGDGNLLLAGCQMSGNTLQVDCDLLVTTGCDFSQSALSINAGTLWEQRGCNFDHSGITSSAAPGTLDFSYWGGTVLVTAAATATLPSRALTGFVVTIKNGNAAGSGSNVTVGRNGNNIDGVAADDTLTPLQAASYIGDGTNWWRL
jgi:hypothetical protein